MSVFKAPEEFYDAPQIGEGRSPRWFACIFYCLCWLAFKIAFRFKVHGREYLNDLDGDVSAVLAGNHLSMIDPLFPWLVLKGNVRFLAKDELFHKTAILTQMLARVGAIPIVRDSAESRLAIKRSVHALKRGEYVGIYPEGTRRKSEDEHMEYHAGATLIAQMAKCKMVPVGIDGTQRMKLPGKKFIRFPKVHIWFGPAVDLKDFEGLPKHERAQAATDEVMRRAYALRAGQTPEEILACAPCFPSQGDRADDAEQIPRSEGEAR